MSESSKNRITGTWWQALYLGDKSLSIETGGAKISNNAMIIDGDEKTEISYIGNSSTGDVLHMTKGRIWLNQIWANSDIELKNLTVSTKIWDIIMLEQNNQIYSTVYVLKGDVTISTSIGKYTLHAGNRIMISGSDLSNPGLQIGSLVGTIDESITQNQLFIRNNWKELLTNLQSSGSTNTWTSNSSTGTSTPVGESFVTILEPKNWAIIETPNIVVRWTINSTEVQKVTINNQETNLSPVNKTFTIENFPIWSKINDIIYKAYNADWKQIETWVITVLWWKQAIPNDSKLVPNSSPISSKDFRIISPGSNPFVTTDRLVKVQWTVPKGTVSYIVVNDYRLQKYSANTTTWYYFANMDNETMRDGINLYTIKFYGLKDEILYTQLFTIIKESKNVTLSGESSR